MGYVNTFPNSISDLTGCSTHIYIVTQVATRRAVKAVRAMVVISRVVKAMAVGGSS